MEQERQEKLRRMAWASGLSEEQIDDCMRIIDRIATETTLTRLQAESFIEYLIDYDDDLRIKFEKDWLDSDTVMFRYDGAAYRRIWLYLAREEMTKRKEAHFRKALGLS